MGIQIYYPTNDMNGMHFPEEYHIYDSINGETEYLSSESELLTDMARRLEVDSISSIRELDSLIARVNEEHPDDYFYYHKVHREPNN